MTQEKSAKTMGNMHCIFAHVFFFNGFNSILMPPAVFVQGLARWFVASKQLQESQWDLTYRKKEMHSTRSKGFQTNTELCRKRAKLTFLKHVWYL